MIFNAPAISVYRDFQRTHVQSAYTLVGCQYDWTRAHQYLETIRLLVRPCIPIHQRGKSQHRLHPSLGSNQISLISA